MLRTALGPSKHSTAFRRAMAKEFLPLRSYSVEQAPASSRFAVKGYMAKLLTSKSKESENMLKYFRKFGVISVLGVFAAIGYAVYDENFNGDNETEQVLNKAQFRDYPMDLSQDIRYQKRGN
ncbi:hypothetical protein Cantr_08734 [Candida viswanathii]|uniref:Uncharacterized protein n=1 Tax=Candida viswanathii TaxID=5486 RepID=A0A367Y7A0_9ASCO|nr:hypothetical protein Cantr_08734 [Candida viswanathii]